MYPLTLLTDGKIYLISTPSLSSTHEFIQKYVKPAESMDQLIKFTIYDNPLLTKEKIQKVINNYPLKEKDPQFRREYLCEIVDASENAVIPKFSLFEHKITGVQNRPVFYDRYVAADIGFRDLTVFLFAYYDYEKQIIVVEDELVIHGADNLITHVIANKIHEKEKELYWDNRVNEVKPATLRVMDNDLKLINELQLLHGLNFTATEKTNKEIYINMLRMDITREKIMIHPRCVHLLYHLRSASWNKKRTDFERLPDIKDNTLKGGHADALDACIYLIRNVMRSKNPFPAGWGQLQGESVFSSNPNRLNSELKNTFKSVLNMKTRN
jgi:hypothetical protein